MLLPYTVNVVFRVYKTSSEVFALILTGMKNNCCDSYQHVGQHSLANYRYCISISRPAEPEQYAELKAELERIGDAIRVRTRRSK